MEDFSDTIPLNKYKNDIKSITISGIKSIGSNVFKDYINLESITISSSVKNIGVNPFIGCNKLIEIKFESDEYLKYENGMILTKDNKELITYLDLK
jgi:hypothetical protein